MRSGITALAAIQVEKLENVAYVPIHAVISEGANHYCFLPKDGAFEQRRVVIGKNNQHYVEVSEGLAVGEKVLLYDPREGEPTDAADEEDEEDDPAGLAPSMASAAE
jgi:multidrug efflux pump subunit AcrA (membrane-fusion protein)